MFDIVDANVVKLWARLGPGVVSPVKGDFESDFYRGLLNREYRIILREVICEFKRGLEFSFCKMANLLTSIPPKERK